MDYLTGFRLNLSYIECGLEKHLDYLTGFGLILLYIEFGLIKWIHQAGMPLEKYEDFLKLFVKQLLLQLSPISLMSRQLPLRKIDRPPDKCPQGKLLPRQLPWGKWQYPPGNFSLGKLPFGWFLAYIIAPRKTAPPTKIVSRINYTQYIFFPRIRNHSTFIDNCFLFFSFFVV